MIRKALECARLVLSQKAQAVKVYELTPMDVCVIASGSSARQLQSMADGVSRFCKEVGQPPLGVEGYEGGRWILMDLGGGVTVHLLLEELRAYYDLESLWKTATGVPIPSEFYHPLR